MSQKLRLKIGECEIEAEGEDSFIEKHVTVFFERIGASPETRGPSAAVQIRKSAQAAGSKTYSAAEFYRQKRPDGGTQSLVVLGKYLQEFREKQEFARKDINALCSEIRIKDIHPEYYTLALKQGLLKKMNKGFAVTLSGDEVVDRMIGSAPAHSTAAGEQN
jgi:hypothetical protein